MDRTWRRGGVGEGDGGGASVEETELRDGQSLMLLLERPHPSLPEASRMRDLSVLLASRFHLFGRHFGSLSFFSSKPV